MPAAGAPRGTRPWPPTCAAHPAEPQRLRGTEGRGRAGGAGQRPSKRACLKEFMSGNGSCSMLAATSNCLPLMNSYYVIMTALRAVVSNIQRELPYSAIISIIYIKL